MAAQGVSRSRKRAGACANYLEGRSRKAHKLRQDIETGLQEQPTTSNAQSSTTESSCTNCKPVLEKLLPTFQAFTRRDIELRHRKRVLPNPRKPDKQHYRNLVAQNEWIRGNLFDALGNYRFCQACISETLQVGSQRLAHQRTIKR